jgi:hypothetical protein
MFCPRCGQQQATDALRFCSRCGFPLEGALHLLAHGGMLPQYQPPHGEQKISPRRRGVKQGALLMLIGAVLVPILGVLVSFAPQRLDVMFEFFLALTAIICFVGGPLRMLFAAIFEEGAPSHQFVAPQTYAPPAISPPVRAAVLPPQSANPATQWPQRPQTAEIYQPSSVTDHTTRLLEKSERESE